MKNQKEKDQLLLYRRTQEHLEQLVRQGVLHPGEKIPGERVLARQLNVSRDTVRAALRELESQDFLIRVPAKGTFIRRSPVRTFNVAFVFPEPEISLLYQDYDHYIINAEVWRGIVGQCAKLGATVSFKVLTPKAAAAEAERFAGELMENYSGVIFPSNEFRDISKILDDADFPNVNCTGQVFYDQSHAIKLAASHLLENGCKKVMLLSCQRRVTEWHKKVSVFRREFAAADIMIPDANVIMIHRSPAAVYHQLCQVMDSCGELPDGIFCASPSIGFSLLHYAAHRQWQLPEQVKIIGYGNDMTLMPTIPALTHIRLPYAEIGAEAVRLIAAKLLDNRAVPEQTLLNAEIIQGETTLPVTEVGKLQVI